MPATLSAPASIGDRSTQPRHRWRSHSRDRTRFAGHCILCIAISLLAGCMRMARIPPKPLSPIQTAAAYEERTLNAAALRSYLEANLERGIDAWPPDSWDLATLTVVAFYYHPDLDAARADREVVEAAVITAGMRPNPTFGFNASYVMPVTAGIFPWILFPSFDLPIETAGKRGLRVKTAKEWSEAARLNIGAVAWQVRARVRTQLVDHLLSVRELELLRAEESTRAEYVSLLETKLAFEDIPRLNVEAARIELARTQLSVKSAQGRVEETRAAVAAALGVPVQALAPARFHHTTLESPPPFEALSLETLEREALMNRLDIRRSLAEYSAIESSLQLELARRVPDIQIGPSFRWRELDRRWVSNLSLPIPLLNRNEGPIAESLARRQQIATNLLVLQSSVVDEIARATARYRASLEQMETANQLLSAAAAREADILELFAVDDVDRTAVVGSRLEVLLAEQGRLAALRRAQMELGTLENAVQVPLESGTAPPISIPQDPKQVRP